MAAGTLPPPRRPALLPRTPGLPRCGLAPACPSHCWLPLQRELPRTVCATQRPQDLGRRPRGGPGEESQRAGRPPRPRPHGGQNSWAVPLRGWARGLEATSLQGLPELPDHPEGPSVGPPAPPSPAGSSPHPNGLSHPVLGGSSRPAPSFPFSTIE